MHWRCVCIYSKLENWFKSICSSSEYKISWIFEFRQRTTKSSLGIVKLFFPNFTIFYANSARIMQFTSRRPLCDAIRDITLCTHSQFAEEVNEYTRLATSLHHHIKRAQREVRRKAKHKHSMHFAFNVCHLFAAQCGIVWIVSVQIEYLNHPIGDTNRPLHSQRQLSILTSTMHSHCRFSLVAEGHLGMSQCVTLLAHSVEILTSLTVQFACTL